MQPPRDDRPAGPLERWATWGRALLSTPLFVAVTVLASSVVILVAPLRRPRLQDPAIRAWARITVGLFGVAIDATGLEQLPDGPAIYVFNHQSHMDIPSIYSVVDRTLRAGAKIELFRIPIFGRGMRAAGILPIARGNPSAVIGVYHDAARRFADGYSYLLAPEGTRQDEGGIGPFKKGPFHFAVDAQVPIVPIVLRGTREVLPRGAIAINLGRWRRTVRVKVLAPVETRGLAAEQVPALRDRVRAAMVAAWEDS